MELGKRLPLKDGTQLLFDFYEIFYFILRWVLGNDLK